MAEVIVAAAQPQTEEETRMRKFGYLIGLMFVLFAVAPAFAEPVVIKFAHVVAVDTPKGQAAEYFSYNFV